MPTSLDKHQAGLFAHFDVQVRRLDGKDGPGEKHEHCWYFLLDIAHDPHAFNALAAYVASCKTDYPQLAADLQTRLEAANGNAGSLP